MGYESIRRELTEYYLETLPSIARQFQAEAPLKSENGFDGDCNPRKMKIYQYKVIASMIKPHIFDNVPFCYATGTYEGKSHLSEAARWTYRKNEHIFREQDGELWKRRCSQVDELLFLICGPYNDTSDHFKANMRPILKEGLSGIYEKAKSQMDGASKEEKEFLSSVCDAMLILRDISLMFAKAAKEKGRDDLAKFCERCPWEKPQTLAEAMSVLLFMKEMQETLEGVGSNSFGRLDVDLYPFYLADIKAGRLTNESAYDLVCAFLLCGDCRYDHDIKMVGYADHELENTLTVGGCDNDGNPLYNELTKMFLTAVANEKTIYPKLMCRYSENSPKEYMELIAKPIVNGTTVVLLVNDKTVINSILRSGKTLAEARDYIATGCWDISCCEVEKPDAGNYFNLLKPFEFAIHRLYDKMKKVGLEFQTFDNAKSFEEIYQINLSNIKKLMLERIRMSNEGGNVWDKVDALPIFSSTMAGCLENRKDFTAHGAKYRDHKLLCFGLPNVVDSLMAIKTLVFDEKRVTLSEMLDAVRNNWEKNEYLQALAKKCHGWGDGNEDSSKLAARLNADLVKTADEIKCVNAGRVLIGHNTYTEIRWWGEKTLATPDGRKNGEYFAQGLTPSRLKKIASATDVIKSLKYIDGKTLGASSVVNIILPYGRTGADVCEIFLRAASDSALQSLQLNCVSRDMLLDAQKHPEKYPDLIVRVTGFSARFTSLSPEWQQEVLSRNFYEN